MVNREELISTAIDLTEGHERSFTDLGLSKKLHIPRDDINNEIEINKDLSNFFEKIPKKKIICNSCGNEVEVFPDLEKAYCKCKNTIDKQQIPYWDYSIKNKEIERHYIDKLTDTFEVTSNEANRLILKIDDKYIAILVTTHLARLEDYYLLKGWAKNSDYYVIIAGFYDFLLSSHQDKTSDLTLQNFQIFLEKDIKRLFGKIAALTEQRKKEEEILLKFDVEEKKDLTKIHDYWRKIVDELPVYALQAGDENSNVQGNKFENHVINLLGLTIFDARHIGGQDNADGIIMLYYRGKNKSNVLYPVEVKSFKPKDGKKFCRIKDHEDQLRRYLGGYTSETISKVCTVKSIIMVAYDFDLSNKTDITVIKRIKKDFGVDIILMPLKSLIRLVRLYFEKKISSIYPDIIEDLLANEYITEENIEESLKKMKIRSDRETEHIVVSAKEHIKRSP